MAQDPGESWSELAATLKRLRIASGLSGPELARRTGWSQSKVSRIENRHTRPSVEDVRAWCRETDAHEEVAPHLAKLAIGVLGEHRSWASQNLAERQIEVGDLEIAAAQVRVYDPSLVSGLLQVPAYAEAMFRALGRDEEAAAEAVARRMKRQAALYMPGKTFVFILGEAALYWRPVGADIREAQLRQLLTIAERPNVEIRIQRLVTPAPALPMGFWLFDIPNEGTQGFVEYYAGEKILTQEETPPFIERFEALTAATEFGPAARALIEDALRA